MSRFPAKFSEFILRWFDQHGRKNLPWQNSISPYRVWVSEIMLQQTQVTTVIPYFQRFIQRFPNIAQLAKASVDEVLELWSGLGYYARGRNLHRTAQIIQQQYQGEFPCNIAELQELPGIGRSTAGAILALSMNLRAPILDGNVKRVLTRFHAINAWPGTPDIMKQLWELAERYTPQTRLAEYTQAIMDLGATVCTRSQPKCNICPLQQDCLAYRQGNPTNFPVKKASKSKPVRSVNLLLLQNSAGEILLEKRPPVGIWGGLWSLPECPTDTDVIEWCQNHYHCETGSIQHWPSFQHTFSHFHLNILPVLVPVLHWPLRAMESEQLVWYKVSKLEAKGFPAPIKRLLTHKTTMTRLIHCAKLNKEAEGLDFPPYPGDLGKKIYLSISKEAWQLWLNRQTMLINEYRLNMLDPSSREHLKNEMEKFLFGDGGEAPAGFVPIRETSKGE